MLKIIKVFSITTLTLLAFSQSSMAREFADIYTDCGLGAMIAPTNSAVAAVTNVTFDLGTTAISSNLSSPDTCNGGQEKVASFIYNAYEPLEKDLASGSGTYLDSLMLLAGYTQDQEKLEVLRNGFAKIVANPSYVDQNRFEKAKALYDLVINV
ncbi:conserved hypothetical protein, secreted [Candidatus Thiomargarita nelsonii]|uniref:Secreted protein n=1 Tax=Candidatus Thiomargarita nelsonii TaxID=1003181 RepID=A0A0A6RK87_9GAMM|nr:conserved hypothetical protein, secreted [Candidatus Thiomargarita nelsonii]